MATNLKDFIGKLDVIPFQKAERGDFDLLQAATIKPRFGGGADIVRLRAGFTANFFTLLGSNDGNRYLQRLLGSASITALDPLIGISESADANSGRFGLSLSAMIGASGRGAASSAEETRYSLTNVETQSLEGSPLLVPFLEEHMPTLAKNAPALQLTFKANPTWYSGSIDKVVAIVITTVTGTAEIYQEKAHMMSGGAKVPPPAPAATKVGVSGSLEHSSSQKEQQNERSGVLGASFCLVHLRKSFPLDDVKALDSTIVNSADDPSFLAFLRRIKLKEFRKLITGRAVAPLGVLTEKKSEMKGHSTLDGHVDKMKRDVEETAAANQLSLGVGGWDDDQGLVNLKIARGDDTMELDSSQRFPEGADIHKFFAGSWNVLFSAPRTYLSKKYQDLKEGKPLLVAGETVEAMSPAFTVKTSSFLPICFIGGDGDEEVPGAVVRDFDDDTAFIFPVEGYEKRQSCATVYSKDWEVRESIIRLRRSNNEHDLSLLKQRGFHEIEFELNPSNDKVIKPDEIVMGRHQLARVSDPVDDGNSIFRAQATFAAAEAQATDAAAAVAGSEEGNPTKKQKS